MLGLMHARVGKMHNLIEGILQYSRIGRVQEHYVKVDLNKIIPDIAELVAPPKHVTIHYAPTLPTLIGESTRIFQVFQNLIDNAVKYMDKSEGYISISAEDIGDRWKISVEDNGPGIDEKYHEKIFQVFQSLNRDPKTDSTGIGLSLVKRIVKKAGGDVSCESKVGLGTTFIVEWPKTPPEDIDA